MFEKNAWAQMCYSAIDRLGLAAKALGYQMALYKQSTPNQSRLRFMVVT